MGVGADEDVLVLPRHRDHLVVPGNADVDADELELGKVAGDIVESRSAGRRCAAAACRSRSATGRPASGSARRARSTSHRTDSSGDRRRQLEPVRIDVRADEAKVAAPLAPACARRPCLRSDRCPPGRGSGRDSAATASAIHSSGICHAPGQCPAVRACRRRGRRARCRRRPSVPA